jgi:endo-1,4-beta-xylanase
MIYLPLGLKKGHFTATDLSIYFMRIRCVNEPSIVGTATFNQYISVRSSPHNSGIVTIENHFLTWYSASLKLSSLNYQVITIEGWGREGAASQNVSN